MRAHLRDYFRHAVREVGARDLLGSLGDAEIALLDKHASRFKMTFPDGTMIVKVMQVEDSRAQSEAFLWSYFSEGFHRGYRGPPVPPFDGRSEKRFADRFAAVPLINTAHLIDITLLSTADSLDMRRRLLCADRGSNDPNRPSDLGLKMQELLDADISTQQAPDASLPDAFGEDPEVKGEHDPLIAAFDDIQDRIKTGKRADLIVVRVRIAIGGEDAHLLLHEGLRPVENVMNLLVQMLGTLDSLFKTDGFVHGRIELRDMLYEMIPGPGSAELRYTMPDGSEIVASSAKGFPVFAFGSLGDAHLSERRMFDILTFTQGDPMMQWARDWETRRNRIVRSSDFDLHALDLHALGLNVIESIAWRLANMRDPPKVKNELWEIAIFCHKRLLFGSDDFDSKELVPPGKSYRVDLQMVWRVYRIAIKGVLQKGRASAGDRALATVVFGTYSAIGFWSKTEPGRGRIPLVDITSDPVESAGHEVLGDVIAFPPEIGIHVRRPRRMKNWWTHSIFDPHREGVKPLEKKRRVDPRS